MHREALNPRGLAKSTLTHSAKAERSANRASAAVALKVQPTRCETVLESRREP